MENVMRGNSCFPPFENFVMMCQVSRIEEQLDYQFKDQSLLKEALSHPSLSSEIRPAPPDNQRLEYLGDAVLELVISSYLYKHFPLCQEGPLTKLRASIVSRNALAGAAGRLNLGSQLYLSKGEEGSGGRTRPSNLADAIEALIGAIYLDGGIETASTIILRLLSEELQHLDPDEAQGNTKGELQEILQSVTPEAPIYKIIEQEGPPHDRTFTSSVFWKGTELGRGVGASKKIAEAKAAGEALKARRWE